MMTKEEYEYLQTIGYLSAANEREILTSSGVPIATFDPISPMICQSNQIAYNMAELANANFSALHTEQAARMDDICTQFATPYNEPRRKSHAADNAKIEGLLYVPLKPKGVLEDFWDSLDIPTQCDIVNAMWTSFAYGVVIPFCVMWLICDHFLPFF
jgi:hypothetical protein